jgi:hypothetical protein
MRDFDYGIRNKHRETPVIFSITGVLVCPVGFEPITFGAGILSYGFRNVLVEHETFDIDGFSFCMALYECRFLGGV